MNRKGFTLIELLATIVIIGLIGGIATYGVVNTINTSKLKSEKIFIDKLSNLIDDYLDLYSNELTTTTNTHTFRKCRVSNCTEYNNDNSYLVTATKLTSINISNLIDKGIITYQELKNPKNKLECFDTSNNPEIKIYKDTDYVYHYYVDLSNNKCDITEENKIINNLPDTLKSTLGL